MHRWLVEGLGFRGLGFGFGLKVRVEGSGFIFHPPQKKMAGIKSWSRISGSRFRMSHLTGCFVMNIV
jgi:hypothetical protein